ncbi:MAG: winged helix-turn-helix domain-containing protein [Saprospiraceae bacterium]
MVATTTSIKILPLTVVLIGALALQLVWLPKKTEVEQRQYLDKINLSLRQVGHRLLANEGNTTEAIAPVQQLAANEFMFTLKNHINYDSLPVFLKSAFDEYGISEDYLVSVKDCGQTDLLLLGFASQEAGQQGGLTCLGRDQSLECMNIHVVFPELAAGGAGNGLLKSLLWGSILLALAYLIFSFFKQRKQQAAIPVLSTIATEKVHAPNTDRPDSPIRFGRSSFDVANQTLQTGETRQELTFREAKLLHLFCKNTNQLLDRNFILQEVWEDEGVIVGRSLDVFVSRLRKILKNDDSVKIANVHGVGYRFEIIDNH